MENFNDNNINKPSAMSYVFDGLIRDLNKNKIRINKSLRTEDYIIEQDERMSNVYRIFMKMLKEETRVIVGMIVFDGEKYINITDKVQKFMVLDYCSEFLTSSLIDLVNGSQETSQYLIPCVEPYTFEQHKIREELYDQLRDICKEIGK